VVGSDRLPDFDDYRKLKYVEAAVKESLRIFSPIPVISKQASESNLSGGVAIPSGVPRSIPRTSLLCSHHCVSHRPT